MPTEPPPRPRRLAYLGSPEAAVPPLEALLAAGFDVPIVVTRLDKRRGRRGGPEPTPVKVAAAAHGIPVAHEVEAAVDAAVDLGVVVAFGRIIGPDALDALAFVNLHFSLLPRWRGAAPVERAILAGDERTGVDLMRLEQGLDTGPVYARHEEAIAPDDTAKSLRDRLALAGAAMLVDALEAGLGQPTPQIGEATYAEKITPKDLRVDWSMPAAATLRAVRVGGAWTEVSGRRLKIHDATVVEGVNGPIGSLADGIVITGDGGLRLVAVQPEGKRSMTADAWLTGARLVPGTVLG